MASRSSTNTSGANVESSSCNSPNVHQSRSGSPCSYAAPVPTATTTSRTAGTFSTPGSTWLTSCDSTTMPRDPE